MREYRTLQEREDHHCLDMWWDGLTHVEKRKLLALHEPEEEETE